jgi:hypothetical protein
MLVDALLLILVEEVEGDDPERVAVLDGVAVVEVLAGGDEVEALAEAGLRVEDGGRLARGQARAAVEQTREELAAVGGVRQAVVVAEAQSNEDRTTLAYTRNSFEGGDKCATDTASNYR